MPRLIPFNKPWGALPQFADHNVVGLPMLLPVRWKTGDWTVEGIAPGPWRSGAVSR